MAGVALPLTPVLTISERSELLQVSLAPSSASGAFAGADFGAFLYAFDTSGSTATQVLVASLNNTLGSATAWAPFRVKDMVLVPGKSVLAAGVTLALSTQYGAGAARDWRGGITLRLRRLS